jgi:hypothetical protein
MKKLILISALLFSFNGWAELVEYRLPDKVYFHNCDGPNKTYSANLMHSESLNPFYPVFDKRLNLKFYSDVDIFLRYQLTHDEEGKVIGTEILYIYPENSEKVIDAFLDKSIQAKVRLRSGSEKFTELVEYPMKSKWFLTTYKDGINEAFSLGGIGKPFQNSVNNYFRLMSTNNYDGAIRSLEKNIQSEEMDVFKRNSFLSMKAEAMIQKKISKNEENFEQELQLLNDIRRNIWDRALNNTELFYSPYFLRIDYFISKLFLKVYQEIGDINRELKETEYFFEIQAIMPAIANEKKTKSYRKSPYFEIFASPDNLRLLTRYGLLAANEAMYCRSAASLDIALILYEFLSSDQGKEYLSKDSLDFFDKAYVDEINESIEIPLSAQGGTRLTYP